MTIGDSIIRELRKMREYACELVESNPICPTFEGIAYQDIPHFQTEVYRTGDEGYRVVNGLMDQDNPAFPTYTQRSDWNSADPFNTLFYDNAFGTRTRFTDIDGLQVYGDGITVDHLTKRMYIQITATNAAWTTSIDLAEASVVGGFSDWHLVSATEVFTLVNPVNRELEFGSVDHGSDAMWTSTTHSDATDRARQHGTTTSATIVAALKTSTTPDNPIAVRIFSESDLNI